MATDATVPTAALLRPFLFILDEFAGIRPSRPQGSLPDTGWEQTFAAIAAAQASRPVAPGGTTIAAQAVHVPYYVELIEAGMRGAEPVSD